MIFVIEWLSQLNPQATILAMFNTHRHFMHAFGVLVPPRSMSTRVEFKGYFFEAKLQAQKTDVCCVADSPGVP